MEQVIGKPATKCQRANAKITQSVVRKLGTWDTKLIFVFTLGNILQYFSDVHVNLILFKLPRIKLS